MKTPCVKSVQACLILLGLCFLQPLSLFALSIPFVEEVKDKKWEKDTLSFVVYFSSDTILTPDMRKDFKLSITYTYNSKEKEEDVADYTTWPQNYPSTSDLFYLDTTTNLSTNNGPYLVYLKLNENYKGDSFPKNFFELDDTKDLKIELYYKTSRFKGDDAVISFERDKDEKYFLGNKAFMDALGAVYLHEQIKLRPQGSIDPLLVFKHNGSEILDSETLDKEESKSIDYILIDVTGKTGSAEADYGTGSSVPENAKALISKSLDLNNDDGSLLTKAADEVWSDVFDGMDFFKNEAQNQCYFVYPPSDLELGSLYECVRCNFNDDKTEPDSEDKVYLISSSSFSGENKIEGQASYLSSSSDKGDQTISELDNNKTYAVLALFKDKTMIRYMDNKDTASDNPTGSSNIDSRVMCKLVKPEPNLTLGEYLGADPSETKKGDPRCFVVSAAYGSSLAKEVDVFRSFRDRVILKLPFGENLMDLYYNNSQPFADLIRENEFLKFSVRLVLWPCLFILHGIEFALGLSSFSFILLSLLAGACFWFVRRSLYSRI